MSAAEIIEELGKLPDREQERVFAYLKAKRAMPDGEASLVKDIEFEKVAEKVFSEHARLFKRLAE